MAEALKAAGTDPIAALTRVAQEAEAAGELGTAVAAWAKIADFSVPRPRPVVLDPDALVDLERRLARVRLEEASHAVKENPSLVGLGERLARAKDRLDGTST